MAHDQMKAQSRDFRSSYPTFFYHTISDDDAAVVAEMQREYAALARKVFESTPPSRMQLLAVTYLEESLMWAVQAIACEKGVLQEPGT